MSFTHPGLLRCNLTYKTIGGQLPPWPESFTERNPRGLARLRGVKLGRPSTLQRYEKAVAGLLSEGLGVCAIARRLGIPLSSAHKVVTRLQGRRSESLSH